MLLPLWPIQVVIAAALVTLSSAEIARHNERSLVGDTTYFKDW